MQMSRDKIRGRNINYMIGERNCCRENEKNISLCPFVDFLIYSKRGSKERILKSRGEKYKERMEGSYLTYDLIY